MSMDFLLRRVGETLWSTPSTNRYKDEQTLQVLIKQSPQLLGTFEVGSVFVDELPINSTGYVDLCGVGPSGSITLVECKLGSNSEIRREVVGQILAYAAGLWRYSYEDFEKSFQLRLGSRERLVDTLRNVNEESATWDDDSFKNAVISNLTEGRFNLVIVVDQITDELKRIVPYINSHTLPEVNFYALEVAYGQHADVEIIHPVTFGIESVEAKRLRNKNVWSEADYFDLLKPHGPVVRNTIDRLYAHAVKHGAIFVSGRGAEP